MDRENVWDYPRLERLGERLAVVFAGVVIAETRGGYRALETSHAPTYYLPPDDVVPDALVAGPRRSMCEWKGQALYFDVVRGERTAPAAAWAYVNLVASFAPIAGFIAFYAETMDVCYVGDERVTPQAGNFYGGWVKSNLVGPIKGAAGTMHW